MDGRNFYVPTITAAMRGKEVLAAAGMQAYVSRNTDMNASAGCSYSISVMHDGMRAQRVLQQNRIRITREESR